MIKSRAIVLHRFPYSDSSWIVKALTEECGIISFIVKGGKRKDSPFRGALDPLALSEIVFRQNPNTELQFIKEATLLDWRKNLREDLLALAKAQVMAEMIMRYAPQGVPLQEEYALFEHATCELNETCARKSTANCVCEKQSSYSAIEGSIQFAAGTNDQSQQSTSDAPTANFENIAKSGNSKTFKNNIFAKWLLSTCEMWGYDLDLGICSRCGHALESAAADFFPETGGFVCKSCLGVESPRAKAATVEGLWALHCGIEMRHPQYTENALLAYLRAHIGFLKEINSIKFLNETRKLFEE